MQPTEHGSVTDLLARAADAVVTQLARLHEVAAKLQRLIMIRADRRWSDAEFSEYVASRQDEHDAHRRFVAASDWYEGVLRRIGREGVQEVEKRDR